MEPTAYARLVANLAGVDPGSAPAPPPHPDTPTGRGPAEDRPAGERVPTRALLDVQDGSSASGAAGDPIDITPAEVRFAQRLGPLVKSPRATKRLLNTYRLIRSTRHVGSRSRFLGGEHVPGECQAVLTLLAIAAGYPLLVDRLLLALQDADRTSNAGTWSQFVAALADPPVRSDPAGAAQEQWLTLARALQECLTPDALDDLDVYRRWGPIVARFSFTP
jgi:hypothetical protein